MSDSGVLAVLKATPNPVRYLFAGMIINQLGAFVQTFLVLYLTFRGVPVAVAGICVAAYSVGSIFGSMAGGELAHRFGSRATIAAAMTCSGPLVATIPFVSGQGTPWALFGVVALAGLVTQAYRPAAALLLADLMPEQHRVMGFSMMRIALNIGAAVAPMLAALLILLDWDLLFWADGATALVWALLAFVLLPKGTTARREAEPAVPATSGRAVYAVLLRDRRFLCYLLAAMFGMIVYAGSMAALPLEIVADGYPTGLYSAVLMISSIVLITCELKITTYIVRIPKRLAGFSGNVVTGLGFALYGLMAVHPVFVVVGALLVVAGLMIHGPSTSSHPATFPAHLRSRYIGTRESVIGFAAATGPIVGLSIRGWLGGPVFWAFCALLSVAAGSLHLYGLKQVAVPNPRPEPEVVGERS
ncbi:MFS transporter [Kutzneria buriramensis]|uniref:MFS transporter n=1 Tax=Kutzneria buriramensis TaxID=1045776 RepID=A0A3E0HIJ0_9PSEU|nr:MFS transporter [Kutzneria buriramensis]REH46016.1 MFS transporter [Kutzneria buriramensis]